MSVEAENIVEVVWHLFPLSENRYEILKNGEHDATVVGINKLETYLRAKGIFGEDFAKMVREMSEKKVAAEARHYGKAGFGK